MDQAPLLDAPVVVVGLVLVVEVAAGSVEVESVRIEPKAAEMLVLELVAVADEVALPVAVAESALTTASGNLPVMLIILRCDSLLVSDLKRRRAEPAAEERTRNGTRMLEAVCLRCLLLICFGYG